MEQFLSNTFADRSCVNGWSKERDVTVQLTVLSDCAAAITVARTGRNPTMKHINRTQRVNTAWV